MKKNLILQVVLSSLCFASSAPAATVSSAQAEAKEVARSGNCTPTKVEVLRFVPGREPQTVFKVDCGEEKGVFVLVQCRSRICVLLR